MKQVEKLQKRIIACELVCAARAIELRAPLRPAAATAAAVDALRRAGVDNLCRMIPDQRLHVGNVADEIGIAA